MAGRKINRDNPEDEAFLRAMGPQAIDHNIQQALSMCWMMLPASRRTVENVEIEVRRVVDRAIQNMKEDRDRFKQP
jgi:hypothetical protein